MLDFRLDTFLALCELGSYTRTAARLHITQPAVTQHIQHIEKHFGCLLFARKGRSLSLTPAGKRLYDFALTMRADSGKIRELLAKDDPEERPMRFGATLSIGEYVLPPILAELLRADPSLHPTMFVSNTRNLLTMLREGKIDFAFLEGIFDKGEYHSQVFSRERFVPVCAANSPLAKGKTAFADLVRHRLILREKGSGTRDIFEQLLTENNMRLHHFPRICEVGNMSAIKQLVAADAGITFLYRVAARKELDRGELRNIDVEGVDTVREFNFVFLKESLHAAGYQKWFTAFKTLYKRLAADRKSNP